MTKKQESENPGFIRLTESKVLIGKNGSL